MGIFLGPLGGNADGLQHGFGALPGFFLAQTFMLEDRFGYLLTDREDGIEGCHGVLENHRHVLAPHVAQLVPRHGEDVLSRESYRSRYDLALGAADHVEDGQGEGGFSGSRLADEAQDLAGDEVEAESVHRPHRLFVRIVADLEVLYLKYFIHGVRLALEFGIEGVAQPVADEVICQHREEDGEARREEKMGRVLDEFPRFGEHVAPLWLGREYA